MSQRKVCPNTNPVKAPVSNALNTKSSAMWWVLRDDRVSGSRRSGEEVKAPERETSVFLEQHEDAKGYPDIDRERKCKGDRNEPLD